MQLQTTIGEKVFDIQLEGELILVDGQPVELQVHRLGDRVLHLILDGRSYVLTAEQVDERSIRITHGGQARVVTLKTPRDLLLERLGMGAEAQLAPSELRAPMPGLVLQVLVEPGTEVAAGDGLVVLEAMKMENELRAELPGKVAAVHIEPGTAVSKNELLVSFD
jgi:biotin carboxyl carrier protein